MIISLSQYNLLIEDNTNRCIENINDEKYKFKCETDDNHQCKKVYSSESHII